jgi:hypothetical protein
MNFMKILKRTIFFVAFLQITCLLLQAQDEHYRIVGYRSAGEIITDNDVLLIDDSGTFMVKNEDPFAFTLLESCIWRFEVLSSDSTYIPLYPESEGSHNVFDFDFVSNGFNNIGFEGLQRLIFENDSSVYFRARIVCVGKTTDNVDIDLELPLLLNFLPSKPKVEIIGYIVIENLPYVQIKYSTARASEVYLFHRFEFSEDAYSVILMELPLQDDNYIHYIEDPDLKELLREYLVFITKNSFGRVDSDTIFIKNVIASTNDITNKTSARIYPNPVADYINIKDEDIRNIDRLSILDISGKTIKRIAGFTTNPINVSDLLPGIYLLRIEYKNHSENKFIKLIKN